MAHGSFLPWSCLCEVNEIHSAQSSRNVLKCLAQRASSLLVVWFAGPDDESASLVTSWDRGVHELVPGGP
eukprot:5049357-Prorocentrum_lima.AAC.1